MKGPRTRAILSFEDAKSGIPGENQPNKQKFCKTSGQERCFLIKTRAPLQMGKTNKVEQYNQKTRVLHVDSKGRGWKNIKSLCTLKTMGYV